MNSNEYMMDLVRSGNLYDLEWLIKKGKCDVNFRDKNGNYPIIAAATRGDINMMTFLIRHGADQNVVDVFGRTPQHIVLKANPDLARSIRSTRSTRNTRKV